MKIAICHTKIGLDANQVYLAWEKAAKLHGDTPFHCFALTDFIRCNPDVAVMVSYPQFIRPFRLLEEFPILEKEGVNRQLAPINTFRTELVHRCNERNVRMIFIDTGILKCHRNRDGDKDNYYQTGYDCIKGLGEYYNKDMPDDRFKKLDLELKPWRPLNRTCLMFGQLQYGIGSQHINIQAWYRYCLPFFKANKITVQYCEHPNVATPFSHGKYKIKVINYAERTNDQIGFSISFSSNAVVDAILNGIPSIAMSQLSSAYKVCTNRFEEYETVKTFDREQWLYDLAYTQWTPNEMESGECWNHLRPYAKMLPSAQYPSIPKIT